MCSAAYISLWPKLNLQHTSYSLLNDAAPCLLHRLGAGTKISRFERPFSHCRGLLFSLRSDGQRFSAACQSTFTFLGGWSSLGVSTCLDFNAGSDLILQLGGLGLKRTITHREKHGERPERRGKTWKNLETVREFLRLLSGAQRALTSFESQVLRYVCVLV